MGRQVLWYLGRKARWIGYALVLVLALVGFLFILRGTAVEHVRGVGVDGIPVGPGEPQFPLSVALLTGTALSGGNGVELALDGDGTFPRLWDDLRAARRSILIQNYYGQPGRVADTLSRILLERAAADVQIFVLLDAFGTHGIPAERLAAFRESGIRVVPFRPLRLATLWRVQNRSHVRAIVVDGGVGWTGGFGIDDKWLGDGHTNRSWRETNVRFTGPAVLQLQAAFAASWSEATGVLFTGRATVNRDTLEHGVTAGLLYAAPTLGSTAAERFLALSIAGARRRLYITNAYFAPDDNFVGLLTRAARRGVDVRLLVGGRRTDIPVTRWAGRARYGRLLAAGVRIYEWQPSTLHAKTFVVDGLWSSIGTMNFDNRSLALNDEVTLMVLDADVGQHMEAQFRDDLHWATEITAPRFAQRPWRERVGEEMAELLTRLL
jgi:cardiolipin synthase A/B